MKHVLIIGAGQIGSLAAFLLARSADFQVTLADLNPANDSITRLPTLPHLKIARLNAMDDQAIPEFIKNAKVDALVSSLPYYANIPVALAAKEFKIPYFDLTEDVTTSNTIEQFAKDAPNPFVPQCGLAPGFVSIVAQHLMGRFPTAVNSVKLRVGALPTNISNALQYSLTWSTDGLINEYGNPCEGIENGRQTSFVPLDDLEVIKIDGLTYEAFNTSGGAGTLVKSYLGKVNHLSYKTIRYPGHCEKMRFLMHDLNMNQDRDTLKRILENSIPRTYQDVVLVYVSVSGKRAGQFIEENYVKKFYPLVLDGLDWSAIQMTTASALCASIDLVLGDLAAYKGLIRQENFSFEGFISNRFGRYYAD